MVPGMTTQSSPSCSSLSLNPCPSKYTQPHEGVSYRCCHCSCEERGHLWLYIKKFHRILRHFCVFWPYLSWYRLSSVNYIIQCISCFKLEINGHLHYPQKLRTYLFNFNCIPCTILITDRYIIKGLAYQHFDKGVELSLYGIIGIYARSRQRK